MVMNQRDYETPPGDGGDSMSRGPRRLRLASKKQRVLTKEYHRPIMQVIDEWLEDGLSVAECAQRIEAETGVPINRNTIYNWLWKREDQREAALAAATANAEEGSPSPSFG